MTTSPIRVRWRALLPAILTLVAGAAAAAPAPKSAAVLGNLTGTGYLNTAQRALANGMRLAPGDRIVLRAGKLTLRMDDGTVIKLAGPAEFTLETPDAAGRALFTATAGRVFVTTRQRSGREVRVQTPSATLAIRGSSGGVETDDRRGLFWCTEGLVYVDAAGQRVFLNAGYQTEVTPGQPASSPAPMSEETHSLNEGLNLEASLNQALEGTRGSVPGSPGTRGTTTAMFLADAAPPSDSEVATQAIQAAQGVLDQLYAAYENEDLGGVLNLLAANFTTSQSSGATSNVANIQESFRHDFANLDNMRFFRQTGTSTRYYRENDQVSLRERWVFSAVLPSGARLQQGGETVFTAGADAGAGGVRILRWEGNTPFGRYTADGAQMTVASPTVFVPPGAGAPDVSLTRGNIAAGGAGITDSDARFTAGGVPVTASAVSVDSADGLSAVGARFTVNGVAITAGEVSVDSSGGLNATRADFMINGVALTATDLTVQSAAGFQATDLRGSVGGAQLHAETLDVSGGTLQMTNLAVTTAQGDAVVLDTATISPPQDGGTPVISGVTSDQQPVQVVDGEVDADRPPLAPLAAGRGEVLTTGQGFAFATETVTNAPADLFLTDGSASTDGSLLAPGIQDLGVVSFEGVVSAPETGYRDRLAVNADLANHVLVLQTESGKFAKLVVRAGTTSTRLLFDWVYNPDGGPALSRGRHYPTRATIGFDAKVYSRDVSGNTSSLLSDGAQSIVEARVETSREYGNGATLEAYLAPRISSDRQVDDQVVMADRFGFKYYRPGQYELAVGDLSGEFTPYSLNQSLLGLVGWRNLSVGPTGSLRLTTVVGPRWQPGAGFKFDGWVSGARLAADGLTAIPGIFEDGVVGLSIVRSERGSRAKGTHQTGLVLAVDAGARLKNGLGLMAEYARSRGTRGTAKPRGEAYLLRATYRVGPLRFIADRERVGAGFSTLSGSAVSNQERTSLWLRYRPNEWLSANINFMRTEDLDRGSPYRTTMNVPRYGLSISPFFPFVEHGFLRNLTVDALLRFNARESDDAPRTIDREYRTLTLSLVQRMGDFFLTASSDNDRDLDALPTGVSRRGHGTEVSLRWRPAFPVSPIVGVRRSSDGYSGGPRGAISSRVTSRRFGVDLGDRHGIAVELGYELLDNNRTDLGGYDRRVLNIDLTRALDAEGGRRAGVTYRMLSNSQQDGTRHYREGQLTGSVSQEF